MRRLLIVAAVLVAAVIFFLLATLPPAPRDAVWAGDPFVPGRTIPGAYHVHTTRSDGSASRADVAAAAARAGLRFVIFTEHGDGTRPPEPPEYLSGVLCLDGVEISTNGGHYAALGLPQTPYPLGGEAHAVVEDVSRLGGFGFAAHASSTRQELSWTDWTTPFDGIEWLNADSEWRDESRTRLMRVVFDYLLRPGPALATLFDRPVTTLTQWDAISARRPIVGIAGHDAHGGIGRGQEGGSWRGIPVPSYEASFRTFSTRVLVDRPFAGDARADAQVLLEALRGGRTFTAIDALARGAYLDFRASSDAASVQMGQTLRVGPAVVRLDTAMPPGAELVLVHSNRTTPGAELHRSTSGTTTLSLDRGSPGAIRAEVRVPGAPGSPPVPWLVSNPIYFLSPPSPAEQPSWPVDGLTVPELEWHVEHDPSSGGAAARTGDTVVLEYRLGVGPRASQFVAAAADAPRRIPGFTRLWFAGESRAPMRVSVQVRFEQGGGERWGRSVYLDSGSRTIAVRADEMMPLDLQGGAMPDPATARSLLFVVDLTNARPGDAGAFRFSRLTFER